MLIKVVIYPVLYSKSKIMAQVIILIRSGTYSMIRDYNVRWLKYSPKVWKIKCFPPVYLHGFIYYVSLQNILRRSKTLLDDRGKEKVCEPRKKILRVDKSGSVLLVRFHPMWTQDLDSSSMLDLTSVIWGCLAGCSRRKSCGDRCGGRIEMGFRKGEYGSIAVRFWNTKEGVVESLPCKYCNSVDGLNWVGSTIERLILNEELFALYRE